jgi:hypothetical protein
MGDVSLIFISLAVLFGTLSMLIWKYKHLSLISGYDPSKIKNKDGYSKFVGKILMYIAIFAMILSLLNFLVDDINIDEYSFIGFVTFSSILSIVTIFGAKKFQ